MGRSQALDGEIAGFDHGGRAEQGQAAGLSVLPEAPLEDLGGELTNRKVVGGGFGGEPACESWFVHMDAKNGNRLSLPVTWVKLNSIGWWQTPRRWFPRRIFGKEPPDLWRL